MTDAPAPTALADWFRRSGYTQRAIAARLDISEMMMSYLVAGTRTPSLPLALKISEVTGIPPADLVRSERER